MSPIPGNGFPVRPIRPQVTDVSLETYQLHMKVRFWDGFCFGVVVGIIGTVVIGYAVFKIFQ